MRAEQGATEALPVSVVIPAYNRPALVARAVRSAMDQRPIPPAEVVVVDDCSSDDTGDAARAAGARVIRHDLNRGEGHARNTAIGAATQPWVALLDSDDEWLPCHLAALWPHRHGRVILGSTAIACGEDPREDRLWGRERETPRLLSSPADLLVDGNALVASSVLVRRDVVLDVGGFATDLPRGADLDLWLRVLEHGPGYVSPAVTVAYRVHEGQVSDDRAAMWSAHRAIVWAYANRPWCTPAVRHRAEGIVLWDELRAALGQGDRSAALRRTLAVALNPQRSGAVVRLLTARFLIRRRTSRYGRDGRASVRVWSSSSAVGEWASAAYSRPLMPAAGFLDVLRRPAGVTVTDSRARALVARLGRSTPVRVRNR